MKDTQTPKTISEVGIYLSTMDRRLENIEHILSDEPSRREFDGLETRVSTLEEEGQSYGSKYLTRRDGVVATGVLSLVITVALFILNTIDKFGGGK